MWRKIGAGVAGLIIAFLFVECAEALVHHLYPPPPGTNMNDFNAVRAFVATLPLLALVLVLTGWLLATLAGTFAAARIGRSAVPGYVVGALLLAAGIVNSVIIPQPVWFSGVSFAIYIVMTLAGTRLARRSTAGSAAARYNPPS